MTERAERTDDEQGICADIVSVTETVTGTFTVKVAVTVTVSWNSVRDQKSLLQLSPTIHYSPPQHQQPAP